METIIVDENEDKLSLILRELELISKRLLTIESTLNMNACAKTSFEKEIETPKTRTRINSSMELSKILERQSFEASKLVKSAEDINVKTK